MRAASRPATGDSPTYWRGRGGSALGLIVATLGDDYNFLSLTQNAFDLTDRGVGGREGPAGLDAFVYTERGVYRSGETVFATALLRDALGAKFVLLAYFGKNDANGVNGGNNNLTYNGVAYTDANIQEGKYSFWGYEHLVYRSTLTGNAKTVADQLASQIKTTDATVSGLLLPTMHVSRTTEGAVITHN